MTREKERENRRKAYEWKLGEEGKRETEKKKRGD